jgi:hypothetical protein
MLTDNASQNFELVLIDHFIVITSWITFTFIIRLDYKEQQKKNISEFIKAKQF